MIEGEFTVLDHLDDIQVPGKVFEQPVNEYWALLYLWEGLEFLYRQVKPIDELVMQRVNPDGKMEVLIWGNHPDLKDIPKGLLTSAFHWYAVSAYQYVRTVGAISYSQSGTGLKPHEYISQYLSKVIPEVHAFRDKVAAHFAWATKNERDTDAERLASILPQLSFVNDSFSVQAVTVAVGKGGNNSTSEKLPPWSICKIHEQLKPRYWPDT